jgi:RNA polymerase sigma-70 factor, ECF subfamily
VIGHSIELDDAQLRKLMVNYQAGYPAAIEELVKRLSPALFRFFSSPGLRPGDVEDILQDFWLRLHRARHSYRPSEPALPWIFAVARHTRLDAYRRRWRLLAREIHFPSVPENLSPTEQPDAGWKYAEFVHP